MTKLLFAVCTGLCLGATSSYASTWYVRVDGGTRYSAALPSGQCDGLADAAYPNNGKTNQHCAFTSPSYLAFDGRGTLSYVVAPGDTVYLGAGQFRVGYRGPNPSDSGGLSVPGDPFQPGLPGIPGGTPDHPTRIIGSGSTTTQIFAGYGARAVLDLTAGAYAISGVELTDHGQCRRYGPSTVVAAYCSSDYPLDDYASNGLLTSVKTSALNLSDVNIHGFASRGILGPLGGNVVTNNVRIAFNGAAGWDLDDGNGTKSINTSIENHSLVVTGNGFDEEYPVVHTFPAISGYDQNDAGYGDGFGTPDTPLNFSCDRCTFSFNTQDGLDLLHDTDGSVVVTNSVAEANMGQQWKFGAVSSLLFQNDLTIHDCARLSDSISGATATYNRGLTNMCRAAGDGIALVLKDGGAYTLQSSSYLGYGSTAYDISCAAGSKCSSPMLIFENMLNIGLASTVDGQLPGALYLQSGVSSAVLKKVSANIFFNFRNVPEGSSTTDPKIVTEPTWSVPCTTHNGLTQCGTPSQPESIFDSVDFHLTTGSGNAIGAGDSAGPAADYDGLAWGSIRDIGAFKYNSGGSTSPSPTQPGTPAPPPTSPTSPTAPATPSPLSALGSLAITFNADGTIKAALFTPVH